MDARAIEVLANLVLSVVFAVLAYRSAKADKTAMTIYWLTPVVLIAFDAGVGK